LSGDEQLRGMALTILGRSSVMSTDPRRSTEVLEEAIGITQFRDPIGSSLAADSLAMAYATLGEMCNLLRGVYGEYREPALV